MKKKLKVIEHPEAPSGYVTMYNYKEPFMEFSGGYGFEGALLFDGKTEKVQCHFCGRWEGYLPNHLHKEHNMTARDYKEKVGLRQSTALLSEKQRDALVINGIETRKQNLIPGKRSPSKETREKIRESLKNVVREDQNKTGTCLKQLIDRLYKLYTKLGRTPAEREIPFIQTLRKVHGSLERACFLAGIPYRKPGENVSHTYTLEQAARLVIEKKKKLGKMPIKSMFSSTVVKRLGWKKILVEVQRIEEKFVKGERVHYSKEMLLDMLKWFLRDNGREASASDCRRNLLPGVSTYAYHFGSWKEAKEAAYGS